MAITKRAIGMSRSCELFSMAPAHRSGGTSMNMLRPRHDGPSRRAAKKGDELAPFQPMESHAPAATLCRLEHRRFSIGQSAGTPAILQPGSRLHCTPEVRSGSKASIWRFPRHVRLVGNSGSIDRHGLRPTWRRAAAPAPARRLGLHASPARDASRPSRCSRC